VGAKLDLDQALRYSDKSIAVEDRFENQITRAQVLDALGRKDEAKACETKALTKATPLQTHLYGRTLQQQKRQEEAFAVFRANAQKNPNEWYVHSGLARIYSAEGKFDDAAKEMKLALAGAPSDQKDYVESLVKRLEARQDINP
jgi:Flp pilus assembly protein TadD